MKGERNWILCSSDRMHFSSLEFKLMEPTRYCLIFGFQKIPLFHFFFASFRYSTQNIGQNKFLAREQQSLLEMSHQLHVVIIGGLYLCGSLSQIDMCFIMFGLAIDLSCGLWENGWMYLTDKLRQRNNNWFEFEFAEWIPITFSDQSMLMRSISFLWILDSQSW